MKNIALLIILSVLCLLSVQFYSFTSSTDTKAVDPQERFPDYGFLPNDYSGTLFKLSQDYPTTLPAGPLPAFFKTDFKKDWRTYMLQVRDYCFEGNTGIDFRVENNVVRKWYHMPWQHWDFDGHGREGIHGLTKEAPIQPLQLAPTQTTDSAGAWAVGFYNEIGGYTIGKVWKDHDNPDASVTTGPKGGFKEGAVLFKLLFASIPKEKAAAEVPSLANGLWWKAFVSPVYKSPVRAVTEVALIQMDILVRDSKAPTGWIAGTFQYNGKLNKANKWENLVPVGLMWGNDPDITDNKFTNAKPKVTRINPELKETVINPDTAELPATHLGWNGRLNGPVDNPKSSCLSCHATAQYPAKSPLNPLFFPKDTIIVESSKRWMLWFQNTKCATVFSGLNSPDTMVGVKSTDFSLQLADALQNFDTWKMKQNGLFASQHTDSLKNQRPSALMLRSGKPGFKGKAVYTIRRNQ
ncbi:hypothetical protein [Spirosoma fluviale]|nr:hypothetical protein [Spirosoma fluviale]